MKTAKTKKYDLRPVVVLLVLAAFLAMSTYAWFTTNRLVKVNSLDITVQASEGFQISLDAINWKTVIQTEEILGTEVNDRYSANVNHIPEEMVPVSTALTTNGTNGFMNTFLGTAALDDVSTSPTFGQYVFSASEVIESQGISGYYIAFDLFFKINYEMRLHLDTAANVLDIGVGATADKGIENAARIGFVNQGTILATSSLTGDALVSAAQGLRNASGPTDGSNVTVWEPNYDAHTAAAKLDVLNLYGISELSPIWNDRIPYDGVLDEINAGSPILLVQSTAAYYSAYFRSIPSTKIVTTPQATPRANTTDTGIVLQPGVTKMRIYIWLEGQDYDCVDSAAGSEMRIDLILAAERI